MRLKFRWGLILWVLILGISLFGIFQYIKGGAGSSNILNGLLTYVLGLTVSLVQLRTTLFLMVAMFIDRTLLRMNRQRMLLRPRDSDVYLAQGILLMRLASYAFQKTRLWLSWDDPKKHAQWINQQLTKNLELVSAALQALDTAYQLDIDGILARKGGTFSEIQVTPQREQIAQANLARCKTLLSQEAEESTADQPGNALLEALYRLTSSIWLNPLFVEAFESGSLLMASLHREELASTFQKIGLRIAHAHEQVEGKKTFPPTMPGSSS